MATLKGEVKAFIVQSLACFDTPSQVVELVKKEFGLSITRQQVESHDPTKANGRGLAQKWVELFHETRKRFQTELSDIPIANKAYRLRALDRMMARAEGMKNMALTASIGQTNANVQTTSQAVADINGKLSAQWGVKVQVEANGVKRIAGIQLGIDGTGASNFLISADTFAVYNPTTNGQELVFASTGGQMFMRSVFIQDGSIDNGKIGNYIQSSNWDGTGNVGWHINKSGYATFNGVTVRGTIYATDGSFKGRVEATSGSFKGTVEATNFIGDVANVGVSSDTYVSGGGVATNTITFTDSSSSSLNKSALLEAMITASSIQGEGLVNITLNINGDVRDLGSVYIPAGTGGLRITVRHAVRNITANVITGTITVTGTGTASKRIAAPTLTITRGTGSFS